MAGHDNFVLKVRVTPDNKNVVSSSSDNTMRVWDIEEGKPVAKLLGHTGYIKGLSIGAHGKYLLSASLDQTLRVWDLRTKKQLAQFRHEKIKFSACDFSPNLRHVYGAGEVENQIMVYNYFSDEERTETKNGPIVQNVQRYVKENNDPWKGSIYALKFLIPGLPESFFRYTTPGNPDAAAFDLKCRLLNEIYFPMMPEFYSLLHVCATAPFPGLLEQLLINGYLYAMDIYGNTPLTYALEFNNSHCIDLIINYFKDKPDLFIVTYNDLIMILKTNASIGYDVFNISFFTYSDLFQTQKRGILRGTYESVISDTEILKQRDLDRENMEFEKPQPGVQQLELAYMVSRFEFNPIMGSADSIKLLQLLKDSSLDSIWETDFKYLIDHKWKKASVFLACFACAHLLFLIGISFYATEYIDSTAGRAIALFFAVLFCCYEILQIISERLHYFQDVWNVVDIAGYVLFFLHTIFYMLDFVTRGSTSFRWLLSVAVLFLWFRAIGDMRAFSNTRYIVRLVVEVLKDMISFAILLAILIYTYAVI